MRHKISLASEPDSIGPALDELESCLIEDGVSTEHVLEVRLLGEEAITNVVKYASAASMALEVQVTREEIVVVLRDNGKPFDPSSAESPDLEASLADPLEHAPRSLPPRTGHDHQAFIDVEHDWKSEYTGIGTIDIFELDRHPETRQKPELILTANREEVLVVFGLIGHACENCDLVSTFVILVVDPLGESRGREQQPKEP